MRGGCGCSVHCLQRVLSWEGAGERGDASVFRFLAEAFCGGERGWMGEGMRVLPTCAGVLSESTGERG